MSLSARRQVGASILMEMKEFAAFPKGTQRYIRRSLDVGLRRRDAVARWSRDAGEEAAIRAQYRIYEAIEGIRGLVPADPGPDGLAPLMSPLVAVSAFDLAQGRLPSFASYRFLYERLIGAAARPWLPSAFCAAAMLPHLHSEHRRRLLQTLDAPTIAASVWSGLEPVFLPEWVDKIDAVIAVGRRGC